MEGEQHKVRFKGAVVFEIENLSSPRLSPDCVGAYPLFAESGAGCVVLNELHIEQAHSAFRILHEHMHESLIVDHLGVAAPF